MKKKHVLIVIDQIAPSTGGFWTVFDVAKILEQHYRVDFLIASFNYKDSLKFLESEISNSTSRHEIFYFPFIKTKNNIFIFNILKLIYNYMFNFKFLSRKKDVNDLVFDSNKIFLASFIGQEGLSYLSKMNNKIEIYQNHAGSIQTMTNHLIEIENLDESNNKKVYGNYISKVDKVIFQSTAQMNEFNSINATHEKKSIAYLPSIDENKLKLAKANRPCSLSRDKFNLIYVATVQKRKQQLFCIEVLSKLVQQNKDINIFFIGKISDKEYLDVLNKLIHKYSLEDNVYILGYRSDYANFMWHGDLIIHPSMDEGVSRVLREALYMKKCIVASKINGSIDLLKTNNAGILLDTSSYNNWSQAILELIGNKDLKLSFENRARVSYDEQLSKYVYKKNVIEAFN